MMMIVRGSIGLAADGRYACGVIAVLVLLLTSGGTPQELETRKERWAAERLEKAEKLVPPDPNLLEQFLIWMEASINEGWLGRALLGIKIHDWLLAVAVAAICVACVRGIWRLAARYKRKKRMRTT